VTSPKKKRNLKSKGTVLSLYIFFNCITSSPIKLDIIFNRLYNKNSSNQIIIMTATQCEVVLVGCGAPGRGMGWYHAEQLLKKKCPSAVLKYIVEPWFLGAGTLFFFLLFLVFVTQNRNAKIRHNFNSIILYFHRT
jgi:hypothetical protein